MVKENIKPKLLTKNDFDEIEECNCGKPVFRYHNVSKNQFVMKCAYTNMEYDLKEKEWVASKKQPCKLYNIYNGERPIFNEIKNKVINPYIEKFDLEKRLRFLFNFLMVSNHSSTIQEIDLLVINHLKREPRKSFYFPSIGHLRLSHKESFEDYRDRIFSEKIVDKLEKKPEIKNFFAKKSKIPVSKTFAVTKKPVKEHVVEKQYCEFIVDPDDESNSQDSEFESESDNDNTDHSEHSDLSEKESISDSEEIIEESEPEEENYDDNYDDYEDSCDYYD